MFPMTLQSHYEEMEIKWYVSEVFMLQPMLSLREGKFFTFLKGLYNTHSNWPLVRAVFIKTVTECRKSRSQGFCLFVLK